MNYKNTLDWMFSCLPMYQRQGRVAFKKNLTNSILLSNQLHNPENKFKTVHVAGTNGKGSTSHMIASVLQEAGYKVGLYTSPHLKDFRERIKINGQPIKKMEVINFIKKHKSFFENHQLSFFEMTVGLAFNSFAKHKVDIAIIEVGLGGRLDSTNIITPVVSVITNIGFDHTQFLGESLAEIAYEKAGIIKPNIPVIIGENQIEISDKFKKITKKNNAPIYFASELQSNLKTDLKGSYQKHNIKTAIQTLQILEKYNFIISKNQLKKGLLKVVENTGLMGRWQILNQSPKIICDTGHNKEGLQYVMQQLSEENYRNLHIVFGVVNDKNLKSVLPLFPKNAIYYFCKPNIPRGLNETKLQQECEVYHLFGNSYSTVKNALKSAKKNANKNDVIFIGGSTFVVAEVV
ncbi:folylpolyglutamate synthase/dihydrofolate synthase family protein [Lutibacter sp.]|uniref:bifunctional folylpolyglutamate synthase/dihydrofolate synthase n=1 Tax=Lutibacter sp. TaxID=1925666 RepID=UPI0025BC0B0F|nr:folylpolyglutamate synthase/dihydrofolate synthase family protein [Lutibacter sp.]MCF6182841.1 bifunctional folylpolyglutamate synthase/dihydrofolate synthase [Lutibacter sp.]